MSTHSSTVDGKDIAIHLLVEEDVGDFLAAYLMMVTMVMLITTFLLALDMINVWKFPSPVVLLFYTHIIRSAPPIVGHYVKNVGSLHKKIILIIIRYVPVETQTVSCRRIGIYRSSLVHYSRWI